MLSFTSLREFGTFSAASTFATRRSTFMKSSIVMRSPPAAGAAAVGWLAGAAGVFADAGWGLVETAPPGAGCLMSSTFLLLCGLLVSGDVVTAVSARGHSASPLM